MMTEKPVKTFRNLQVLEEARTMARLQLKEKYFDTVQPFVSIIDQVAKANNENAFEAMKRIQDKTDLADEAEKKIIFAAALMEITENLIDEKMIEGRRQYLESKNQ